MNIAAQLSNTDLKLFIEGVNLKKITQPFNKERVRIDLVAFTPGDAPIYHDGITGPAPDTHPTLMFCREKQTLAVLKRKLNKTGYGEPTELRCHSEHIELIRKFNDAWLLTFFGYVDNSVFAQWLIQAIPVLEAGTMLHKLKTGMRYYTRGFSGYREFDNIEAFAQHRFELWHDEVVAEYERAVAKGETRCEGCKREKQELERDI